ncbi:response regulator [Paenibacillus thalictri]|uniref:Response regulator n=1 Tax=Paenibacillus thalictri TaxID=2527873 RepID=A0A4Q9DMK0_9BACL|nr:response regulator [Paenibacillus thalictri]TBL73940.1 response regulator [Paenibacillus thalictri]
MYKLMLVDDEERVRTGLRISLDWEEQHIEIVGEAEGGLEALEIVAEKQPDIIISDVLMPQMDGLEFTQRALEIVPHAKVILLSGYDHFGYVQTAIRYGAFDYMLKPSKVEELAAVIGKAKQAIEAERSPLKNAEELRQQLFQSIPVLKEKYIRFLLMGQMTMEDIRKNYGYLNLALQGEHFMCLVMEIDEEGGEPRRYSMQEKQLLMFALKNISEELLGEQYGTEVIEHEENQLVVIVSPLEAASESRHVERVQSLAKKMQYYFQNYYKNSVSIGIGGLYAGSERIAQSYEEAREALQYRLYSGKGSLVFSGDIAYRSGREQLSYPFELEGKLALALKIGDTLGLRSCTKQFVQFMIGMYNVNPEHLRGVCLQLAFTLQRKLMEWNMEGERAVDLAKLDEQIRKQKTIAQLESWLIGYVDKLAAIVEENKRERNVSIVQKAIAYMEERYGSDISLQDIADSVFLTPNYFANLFKDNTGETAMNVLTNIRIAKAKQLLKTTELKNYEVAEQVGYTDAKYFGQVFKKIVGMTPVEYKKTHYPANS